ncbi:hypothetical protein SGFS_102460 [Streptomyces graminofaciens]|uniref:Uncharacterized protein n=1 Tax=Streptomyces graminofaciens TaxID=68212 RepID=A0ABM7FS73_9ACTN|nr:hypothetical protein [Streptomyces graminofaciens]BBC38952.1 hypothetical protein SGFS_102460 [Streptomyces graminofaciens]
MAADDAVRDGEDDPTPFHVHNTMQGGSVGKLWQVGKLFLNAVPGRAAFAVPRTVTVEEALKDPYVLGVHQSIKAEGGLPAYVARAHDRELVGRLSVSPESNVMAVLVGKSCTGKSRAAFEAVRKCFPDWQLVAPPGAESLVALLDHGSIEPRTVIWLDDLRLRLRGEAGERAAEKLRLLLQRPGPVAVIGAMWPEFWHGIRSPAPGSDEDRRGQARALLNLAAPAIYVAEAFNSGELDEAERLAAESPPLAAALETRSATGRLTQSLAAGPELVTRYHIADSGARAVMTAALEAWRLGWTAPVPRGMLRAAAEAYASDDESLPETWFEAGLAYATEMVMDAVAPLTLVRVRPDGKETDGFLVADFLAQEIVPVMPACRGPKALWEAALAYTPYADSASLHQLASTAMQRGLYRYGARLYGAAAVRGNALATFSAFFLLYDIGEDQARWTSPRGRWLLRALGGAAVLAYGVFLALVFRTSDSVIGAAVFMMIMVVVPGGKWLRGRRARRVAMEEMHRDTEKAHVAELVAKMEDGDVAATLAMAARSGERGDFEFAIRCLRRLWREDLRDQPDEDPLRPRSTWYVTLAEWLTVVGEHAEAERLLRSALDPGFPRIAEDVTVFRAHCTAVLVRVCGEQGRVDDMTDLYESAVRVESWEWARFLAAVVTELSVEPPPSSPGDEEARLRAACARGTWLSMQKLMHHLRKTGSREELDRVRRFGLEPDGTTAAPWGQSVLSKREAAAVSRFKQQQRTPPRVGRQ